MLFNLALITFALPNHGSQAVFGLGGRQRSAALTGIDGRDLAFKLADKLSGLGGIAGNQLQFLSSV